MLVGLATSALHLCNAAPAKASMVEDIAMQLYTTIDRTQDKSLEFFLLALTVDYEFL